jgi:hypothetical protein
MTKPQIQELARFGAEARLKALREEQAALLKMFPELGRGRRGRKASNGGSPRVAAPTRGRRGMSAQARKAVGARMKAYWAAKRAEKAAGGENGQAEAAARGTPRKAGRRGGRKQGRKK